MPATPPPPVLRSQVPMLHVADVARTVAFYEHLGFRMEHSVKAPDGALQWVWLQSAGVSLMFARADEPVVSSMQAALLYLYTDDVQAMHAHLAAEGVTVGEIRTPFYNPRGEFRVDDPDGWCLMIAHTGP